ncbi:MAG: hypothetical protein MJA83_15520, partial [Gammaproteobacteria bacterium]|nr:hypothetical protein [Gammaproteobacteria bacterium]
MIELAKHYDPFTDECIRRACTDDFERIVEMSEKFWGQTRYDDAFDEAYVLKMVELAYESSLLLVFDVAGTPQGFIAGIAIPLLATDRVLQVTEIGFWIDPLHRGHGEQLLEAFELAATERGAK